MSSSSASAVAAPTQVLSTRTARLFISAFVLMAIAIHMLPLMLFVQGLLQDGMSPAVINRDFSNYWVAARLTLAGEQQDLFAQPIYFARAQEMLGEKYGLHNWGYPPHFLLLLWPFGLLGYKSAMVVFLAATLVLFLASVAEFRRTFAPRSDLSILVIALVGYSVMMVDTAQNGFLTSAMLLLGLAWMKKRSVLAGLAFAVLTVKPQLGVLLPALMIFDRNWRAIIWSTLFTALLVGLSIMFFGLESWHAYLNETLVYQRSVMTDWYGLFLRMMPTVFGSVRTLEFSPDTATLVQLPVSIAASVLVLWLLWKESDPLRRVFVVLCATFVVSPYGFNYDMGALTAAAAILVGSHQAMHRHTIVALAAVAAVAGVVTNLGRANIPISPLFLAAALIAIAIERLWAARTTALLK